MTPADLKAWQEECDFDGKSAASALHIPYMTYREYLPGGRRRQDKLPDWLRRLSIYVKEHGRIELSHCRVKNSEDLKAWQERCGWSGPELAELLGLPYMTYREYLPNGRRRMPQWIPIMIHYIFLFDPLPAEETPSS